MMHLTQFFGVTKARWFIYANFFLNKSNSCLVCTNIFVTPQKKKYLVGTNSFVTVH